MRIYETPLFCYERGVSHLPSIKANKSIAGLTPLQLYLQEIAKYPLLEPQEEYDLAVKHFEKQDVGSAHRLVTSNLRLVVKIANEFRNAKTNILDLIQEGNYGLIQAVKKFNPYKGVKLSSYSAWWIKAYILKHLMDNQSQVRIGTTAAQRKLYFNLRKETDRLLKEHDHVDAKMIAESLDVSEQDVVDMQVRLGAPDLELDAPVSEYSNLTRESVLSNNEESFDDLFGRKEVMAIFKQYLEEFKKSLTGRDLEIFEARLMADPPATLQEIGDRYGVTRERARQLESRIVKMLKEHVKKSGHLNDLIDIEQ